MHENFVILAGNKRSGTTFLRQYFEAHSQISWDRQGYHFLNGDRHVTETYSDLFTKPSDGTSCFVDVCEHLAIGQIVNNMEAWSSLRFTPDAKVGDALYLDQRKAAERIKATMPNVRIVIILRNQIDWIRTHYRVFQEKLPQNKNTFQDFLSTAEGQVVLNGGFYHKAIEAYYELFGKSNVLILSLDKMRDDRDNTLVTLCDFLRVDFEPWDSKTANRNSSGANHTFHIRRFLEKIGLSFRAVEFMRPLWNIGLKSIAKKILSKDIISKEEKTMLSLFYSYSNSRTEHLTGLVIK